MEHGRDAAFAQFVRRPDSGFEMLKPVWTPNNTLSAAEPAAATESDA